MSSSRQLNPFGEVNLEGWKKKALADLRGKSLESLDQVSEEGLRRKVLYTREDLPESCVSTGGAAAGIAQVYRPRDGAGLGAALRADWNLGARGALVEAGELGSVEDWSALIPGGMRCWLIDLPSSSVLPEGSHRVLQPLAMLIAGGEFDAADLGEALAADAGNRIQIDLCGWFERGLGPVEELALLASQAVYLLRKLEAVGVSPETLAERALLTMSVDTDFFLGMSKLRVVRELWAQLLGASGVEAKLRRPVLHVRAGRRSWAARPDARWGNLLRACTQGFASALGGADWVALPSFDGGRSHEGQRLATNMQVILREESFAGEVRDPAAGSYYLEALSRELREAVWARFLEIEDEGGFEAQLRAGAFEARAAKQHTLRSEALATGQRVLVGVNRFITSDAGPELEGHEGEALPLDAAANRRLAAGAEQLRARGERLGLCLDLLCAGQLRRYKARADFARDWFAVGGVSLGEAGTERGEARGLVLCAADGDYGELLAQVERARSEGVVWVAAITRPGTREGDEAGLEEAVDALVHMRADAPTTFTALFDVMEGAQ
jgi:methylmalonyl-CoA mutase